MNDFNREMKRVMRTASTQFSTRDDNGNLAIEGYFAVYDSVYQIAPDLSESIAQGAFDNTISDDIRALINHDTTLVLGRTKAGTLQLRTDSHGLWGHIDINPNDSDAMNLYNRVQRGDVDQCSFGFDIINEETDFREDGSVHWTIKEVKLYEVSPCTFPAYEETNIAARTQQRDELLKRRNESWKEKMLKKLKGEKEDA
ncbi:MAG: HK97 family phage prohead protease [Aeriscardovia sp.]|nr:HK97 family phage prohead protease [Aeriscardovia sp.]